jgi:hypothetical protein
MIATSLGFRSAIVAGVSGAIHHAFAMDDLRASAGARSAPVSLLHPWVVVAYVGVSSGGFKTIS